MAGTHRQPRTGARIKLTLRIPAALKADLDDAALVSGRSLNEEILARLMPKQHGQRRTIRQRLMELEGMASDPSVPISQVVAAMESIHPYRGPRKLSEVVEDRPELDALDIDREIQWLNPEKSWFTERPQKRTRG